MRGVNSFYDGELIHCRTVLSFAFRRADPNSWIFCNNVIILCGGSLVDSTHIAGGFPL